MTDGGAGDVGACDATRVPRALFVRLAAFYGAYFLFAGIHLPYFPLWLEARALSVDAIALILAFGAWTKLIADPVAGWLSDRSGRATMILLVLALGTCVFTVLHGPAEGFVAILAVSLLASICTRPMMALSDALTLAHDRRHPGHLDYGRVRLWGSVAFCVANLGGGWVIDTLYPGEPDLILWMLIGTSALVVAAAAALPPIQGRPPPFRLDAVGWLMRQRVYVLMLTGLGLMQGAHAVYYAFSAVHWREAGYPAAVIGALWAEGVVAEILLFALGAGFAAKLGLRRLIFFAAAGGVIRWLVLGSTTDILAVAVVLVFLAATFGATHLAAMRFLSAAVPEGLSATSQGLYSAVGMGVIGGALFVAAGPLYGIGAFPAFAAMAAVSLAGSVLALAGLRQWDGRRMFYPGP